MLRRKSNICLETPPLLGVPPSGLMLDIHLHALMFKPSGRMVLFFPGAACNHNLSSTEEHCCANAPASFVLCIGGMQYRLSTHNIQTRHRTPKYALTPSDTSRSTVITTASTWGVWSRSINCAAQGIGVMQNSRPIPTDTQITSR